MLPNPQFPADLVTLTKEILNGKLHFLCRVRYSSVYQRGLRSKFYKFIFRWDVGKYETEKFMPLEQCYTMIFCGERVGVSGL